MKYISTRDRNNVVSATQAITQGLASDGGLFVPKIIPAVSRQELEHFRSMDYRSVAVEIMGKYLEEFSADELKGFVAEAYSSNYDCNEVAPVSYLNDSTGFLELWHGPTCAFKDMALQMLPRLLTASLNKLGEARKVCILVATSGDTGKAALEGFADVPGTSICVFYPRDGVSDVQKLQMTTQKGENVYVCAVEGNFDDTQTGVKKIFGDNGFAKQLNEQGVFLSSANSINWGRLLPQIVYYFSAYCDYVNTGKIILGDQIDFCVPTGNFGDILAGWYAKQMGLPVRRLICASNSNNVLTDFIRTGIYDSKRKFYTTASPSMDILVSSNLERLLFIHSDDDAVRTWMGQLKSEGKYEVTKEVLEAIKADFDCGYCDDVAAKAVLSEVFAETGYLMDTHTADAYAVLKELRERSGESFPTIVVSTASPFKFCDSVLNALGADSSEPGAQLINALSTATGKKAPAPLASLKGRSVRFNDCILKEDMSKAVLKFLAK